MLVLFINSEATIKKTKKNCYCHDLLFSFVRIDNKLIFILIMDIQNIFIKCVWMNYLLLNYKVMQVEVFFLISLIGDILQMDIVVGNPTY